MSNIICKTCNDTHLMPYHTSSGDETKVPCTRCPIPCQSCRAQRFGAFCENIPCKCSCHDYLNKSLHSKMKTEPESLEDKIKRLEAEVAKYKPYYDAYYK